jgi:hypothetical protein
MERENKNKNQSFGRTGRMRKEAGGRLQKSVCEEKKEKEGRNKRKELEHSDGDGDGDGDGTEHFENQ